MEFWLAKRKYNIKFRHCTERISLGLLKLTYEIATESTLLLGTTNFLEGEKRRKHKLQIVKEYTTDHLMYSLRRVGVL